MNNAKKQKKTKWERLKISSITLEIAGKTFHARMGTVKDKNSKYLRDGGKIKKWQEYTEEL